MAVTLNGVSALAGEPNTLWLALFSPKKSGQLAWTGFGLQRKIY
jgi:hypothetical protein